MKLSGELIVWRWIIVAALILICLPILAIIFQIHFTFFQDLIHSFSQSYTLNTVYLITSTAILSLIFGVSTAWFTSNYEFPMSSMFGWMLMLPLSIPAYIMAYTYKGLFGLFGTIHALTGSYFEIDNIWWLSVIMALSLYPYVYLTTRISFGFSSMKYIRSAQSLGSNNLSIFFKIALPLAWPAVFSGLILVIMEVINNYGAVQYFGIKTFTTEIVRLWNPLNDAPIRNISAILICIVLLLYFLERQIRKRASFSEKEIGRDNNIKRKPKKTMGWIISIVCLIPALFGFIIPVLQLVAWAFKKWKLLFDIEMMEIIGTTFFVGFVAAIISVIISLFIRYFIQHGQKTKFIQALSKFSTLGYAIPGALLGVGILDVIFQLNRFLEISLTSSLFVLIFAYLVRFFSVSYGSIHSGFEKVVKNVGHASFSLGKGFTETLFKIHSPLLRNTLLAAAVLVFVDVIKELPLTMMFQKFNFQTLAVKSFMLMETDGAIYDASLPSLLIVLISIFPVYFVNKLVR